MTDYSLWKVVKNGNKVLKRTVGTDEQIYEPTSVEEKLDRKNKMKAKGTLLMALLNKDQLKFHSYQDEKFLMEAIEKRYERNKESKKVQRTLLKQQYENFAASSSETLDQTFDSTNSTSSINEADNTAFGVSTPHSQGYDWSYQAEEEHPTNYALMALTSSGSSFSSDSESVEERLTHYKKNKVVFEEKINILNLEVKLRDNALVENTKKLEKEEKERDELKLTLEKFQNSSKSLNNLLENQVSGKVKTRLGYKAASLAVESFVNSPEMLENQENVKSRLDKRYHVVPSPYTGNYIPPKPDLTFIDEQVESDSVDVVSNVVSSDAKTVESKHESVDVKNKGVNSTIETKHVKKNSFSPPIINDWNFDDERQHTAEGVQRKRSYCSGCLRHMIRNKCYLSDYENYDGGFVSVRDGKGRISGKGKIETGTLDFDDVYFYKELNIMRRGKVVSVDEGELSGFPTCLFCNTMKDSSVCGDCLQQHFYSCERSFYDAGDCNGTSSQVLSMVVNDVALNIVDHMSFSFDKNLHLGSSINAVQQHLVSTENITPNNACRLWDPLSRTSC
nr:hypothetical protein [Tanacetum cinerariifolium]